MELFELWGLLVPVLGAAEVVGALVAGALVEGALELATGGVVPASLEAAGALDEPLDVPHIEELPA